MNDITQCAKCGIDLISEEIDSHLCLSEIRYIGQTIINGRTFVSSVSYDGLNWIHLERPLLILPTPKMKHAFKTPDYEQNPFF